MMSAAPNSSRTNRLLIALGAGNDLRLFEELFACHRERLRKLIRLRMDPQLRGKVPSATVLDLVRQEAGERIREYRPESGITFYVWLRGITGDQLHRLHRKHQLADLGARDLQLHRSALPEVSAASMAAQLLGERAANQSALRTQMLLTLEAALNGMERLHREIIALRNFEELTSDEAASVLGMSRAAATVLHLRAIKRLNDILSSVPGFFPSG